MKGKFEEYFENFTEVEKVSCFLKVSIAWWNVYYLLTEREVCKSKISNRCFYVGTSNTDLQFCLDFI